MRRVAVVILNWNGKALLEKYLPSVIQYSKEAQVIVADNASSDDSISFLKENYPQIKIIQNKENLGFAEGYNQALLHVNADYYVLLNSDVEVTENWIGGIIDLMEKNPKIACCQPKLLSYNERKYFEYAGAAGGYIDYLGYPFCRGRVFNYVEEDNGQYDDAKEIFWATGAVMFVRASLYQSFGGLDKDFFAHQEEIDFCWRLKNAGYKIFYYPHSVCYHLGGGSLNKTSPFKTFLNFRNNLYLLYKNLPKEKQFKIFAQRFFLDIIAAFSFLMQGKGGEFSAVFKAYVAFLKTKHLIKAKRTLILNPNIKEIYTKSIVRDYYLRGKNRFRQLDF
ncbi:MAG: glycosyltransferase family 2 protein [Bacteroidales bacterium]|jgi:GT2 family glycosyltransferase|nr:glycosyltransferase family 2 protein [Bacteroidales bacterium]MDD4703648.1 glycosyltransferase family 2 protein [Bacteroidales bacterium]MDX9798824.1 glycosyltransferase family 2 protein [Bacteroidales bacterium]